MTTDARLFSACVVLPGDEHSLLGSERGRCAWDPGMPGSTSRSVPHRFTNGATRWDAASGDNIRGVSLYSTLPITVDATIAATAKIVWLGNRHRWQSEFHSRDCLGASYSKREHRDLHREHFLFPESGHGVARTISCRGTTFRRLPRLRLRLSLPAGRVP